MAIDQLDQKNISSKLRFMDDRTLQKYAAMHKNDPYIFPLAFQESQNRKALEANKAAQMGGQEMPKVNEAALMAMAPQAAQPMPEDMGIGRLPAPNMQNMADGGIAGFDESSNSPMSRANLDGMGDTSGMFNYAQDGGGVMRMADGGVTKMSTGGDVDEARARRRAAQDALYRYGLRQRLNDPEGFQAAQSELKAAENELKAAESLYNTEMAGSGVNRPATSRKDVGLAATEVSKEKYPPSEATRVKDFPGVKPGFEFPTETSDAPPVKTGTKTKTKTRVEAPAPTTDAPANLGIVPYGQSRVGDAPATPEYKPQTAEEARAASELMAAPDIAEIQKSYKPFAEQFAQDRTRIEGREKTNLSDALIRGGLKALGGKSQYAMQNISEGGLEGLNAYQEGIKANDAARKALTQSEMLMTQAQRAESRGARADATNLYTQAEKAQQVGFQFKQKAQEIENTKEYQQGVLEHYKRSDVTAGRMADSSMVTAKAAETRASAMGGNADDKHMAVLAKVQAVLNSNPEYKEAAKFANVPGKMGDNARATIKRLQDQVYNRIAPEMLQSGLGSPSGSGGGQNVLDFNSIK